MTLPSGSRGFVFRAPRRQSEEDFRAIAAYNRRTVGAALADIGRPMLFSLGCDGRALANAQDGKDCGAPSDGTLGTGIRKNGVTWPLTREVPRPFRGLTGAPVSTSFSMGPPTEVEEPEEPPAETLIFVDNYGDAFDADGVLLGTGYEPARRSNAFSHYLDWRIGQDGATVQEFAEARRLYEGTTEKLDISREFSGGWGVFDIDTTANWRRSPSTLVGAMIAFSGQCGFVGLTVYGINPPALNETNPVLDGTTHNPSGRLRMVGDRTITATSVPGSGTRVLLAYNESATAHVLTFTSGFSGILPITVPAARGPNPGMSKINLSASAGAFVLTSDPPYDDFYLTTVCKGLGASASLLLCSEMPAAYLNTPVSGSYWQFWNDDSLTVRSSVNGALQFAKTGAGHVMGALYSSNGQSAGSGSWFPYISAASDGSWWVGLDAFDVIANIGYVAGELVTLSTVTLAYASSPRGESNGSGTHYGRFVEARYV